MDLTSMTPAEVKQIVDKEAQKRAEAKEERKMSFWTSVSICLAFIGFFIVGGIVAIGSLVKALSN